LARIFLDEMPKFFGPDTVLWYYGEKPAVGYVFYAIALFALGVGIWPFVKSPGKILRAMRGDLADARQKSDFDMVVLTAASFVPYVSQASRCAQLFLGGCFFLSMLTGRMLERGFSSSMPLPRLGAAAALAAILVTGIFVLIRVGQTNQIETLSLCEDRRTYCMTRIASADIDGVRSRFEATQRDLSLDHDLFCLSIAVRERRNAWPSLTRSSKRHIVCIRKARCGASPNETGRRHSSLKPMVPIRPLVEMRYEQVFGSPPLVREYGKLTVITNR
jgi:hypothetical protein